MKNIFRFNNEYQKYGVLTILSGVTGLIEFFGFEATHSNALGIAIAHMLFHVVFFGILFGFSYWYHTRKHLVQQQRVEKIAGIGVIVLVIALGIFRIAEILEHGVTHAVTGDMNVFRIFLAVITVLISFQWYVLHAETSNDSCGALCHGSEGHLMIDVIGFVVLLIMSFFGLQITSITDIIIFILSGIVLVGTIVRIIKNMNSKK
jgi:hypothetical protein